MADLHDALSLLRPKDFADVSVDDLQPLLKDAFAKAELIANSVPPPPGGNDYLESHPACTEVNAAHNASEMTVSQTRPPPPDPAHTELYKSWGKPLKLSSKDNPLEIAVYKMAGKDRHGAWFARRSIHEGLGFSKWKKAMQIEFAESLAVQGAPGAGNVRGIGGDQRLEQEVVDGLGKMEVYQLSAQFPGPVAPREFVTLLLTSDSALSEKSAPHLDSPEISKDIPRHFMVVSIPVTHPEAPVRDALVRGQYESVEMIREIPLPKSEKNSELNPVEWIMVTRSDPGGGIPRFMVERGTPGSIVADASKFLNWACAKDEASLDGDKQINGDTQSADPDRRFSAVEKNAYLAGVGTSIADKPAFGRTRSQRSVQKAAPAEQNQGILSSLTSALPTSIQNALPGAFQSTTDLDAELSSSDESDTTSLATFRSAEDFPAFSAADDGGVSLSPADKPADPDTDSLASGVSGAPPSRHQKELTKIDRQKTQLEAKLAKQRERATSTAQSASLKSAEQAEKARQKHEREVRRQEEKYQRELRKLEEKREKEARRLEERAKREADKDALARANREREEWKSRAEVLEREGKVLREQIGELQRENTALVARVGRLENGNGILKEVREESSSSSSRRRTDSMESLGVSVRSGKSSGKSGKSSPLKEISAMPEVEGS